ncbi:MAG: hypothetical protein C4547_12945 [Phycisphaerales bacterium]|nr:MAG: hypothetical protein C4547_12945 [Phycisphaerales bacterium]
MAKSKRAAKRGKQQAARKPARRAGRAGAVRNAGAVSKRSSDTTPEKAAAKRRKAADAEKETRNTATRPKKKPRPADGKPGVKEAAPTQSGKGGTTRTAVGRVGADKPVSGSGSSGDQVSSTKPTPVQSASGASKRTTLATKPGLRRRRPSGVEVTTAASAAPMPPPRLADDEQPSKRDPAAKDAPSQSLGAPAPGDKPRSSKASRSTSALSPSPGPRYVNGLRLVEPGARMPHSRLSPKRLAQFKAMLVQRRLQLTDDLQRLSEEAYRGNAHGSDRSNMPIHMADLGTDNWEQEFDLMLLDNERAMVRDIDDALRRIEEGTYGICEATHRPITIARLIAKPWARYCIEYARMKEQGRVP